MIDFTQEELLSVFNLKYCKRGGTLSPGPARRLSYNYFSPDDHYEALVRRLVKPTTRWLDVGCGRNLFPSNPALAAELSARCALSVGVDPDETIHENNFVHKRIQGYLSDIDSNEYFDLVTMRMVAEHVMDPPALVKSLSTLVQPGGLVVVYTVNRWSPIPLITAVTPFALHNPIKYILWRTESKDTFPTTFRMNTRRELCQQFEAGGFNEEGFVYLDDCRTLSRVRLLNIMEMNLRAWLRRVGARYPENCLLGVYRH